MKNLAYLLLLCLLAGGCAPKTIALNGGAIKDPKDVAIIETNPQGFMNSGYINVVDNIDVSNSHVQVEPGVHTVLVTYENAGAPSSHGGITITIRPNPRVIKFEAKKGMTYYPYWNAAWFGQEPMLKSVSEEPVPFIDRTTK